MLLQIFHVSVFALNSFALWFDQKYVDLPFPNQEIRDLPFKARPLFLTIWCLTFQTLYYGTAVLNDVFGTNSPSPKMSPLIRRIKDAMFSVAFTLATYVSTVFWGIYAIDKELIFPQEISDLIPVWLNHVMHSLIGLFIVIELLTSNMRYPSRRFGFALVITLVAMYLVWLNVVYFRTGLWVYRFIMFLSWPLRIVFFIVSTVIALAFYILGENLNKLVSSKDKVYSNGVNGVKKKY